MNDRGLAENLGLADVSGKNYKLFLVEVDDEDRERVLSGLVGDCEITVEPEYADIRTDMLLNSARIFKTSETVTIKMKMVQRADGTYFEIVDFSKEDEEEE